MTSTPRTTLLPATLEHVPDDARVAVLMRHADRENIQSVMDAFEAPLNADGERAARALGEQLAPRGPLQLHHSPVPRCGQTARCLAEGARAGGAETSVEGVVDLLGDPSMFDWEKAVRMVLEIGVKTFVTKWFAAELPAGLAMDPLEAATRQLQVLVDQLEDPGWTGLRLNVSHDWNVLVVRKYFVGQGLTEAGWPAYLDGVAAWLHDGGLRVRFGEHERDVPLPLA